MKKALGFNAEGVKFVYLIKRAFVLRLPFSRSVVFKYKFGINCLPLYYISIRNVILTTAAYKNRIFYPITPLI